VARDVGPRDGDARTEASNGKSFSASTRATDAVVRMLGAEPYAARLVLREAMGWDAASKVR
jgi:hypothetical protein